MVKYLSLFLILIANSSAFADSAILKVDRQELYPAIELYNRWLAVSPDTLPTDGDYLDQMDGAILLEKRQTEYVVELFSALNLIDFAVDMTNTKDTQKIPYSGNVEWKLRGGRQGTFHMTGYLQIVDKIFHLNLNQPKAFRDKFVANVHVDSVTGDLVLNEKESNRVVTDVLAPFIAGKLFTIAEAGFSAMERQLKDKLQEEIDKIPPQELHGKDI